MMSFYSEDDPLDDEDDADVDDLVTFFALLRDCCCFFDDRFVSFSFTTSNLATSPALVSDSSVKAFISALSLLRCRCCLDFLSARKMTRCVSVNVNV